MESISRKCELISSHFLNAVKVSSDVAAIRSKTLEVSSHCQNLRQFELILVDEADKPSLAEFPLVTTKADFK